MKSVSILDEMAAVLPTGGGPAMHLPWTARRDGFRALLKGTPVPGISNDELSAHFDAMPPHYWERVSEEDLIWSLETIHGFLKLVAAPNVPATAPFLDSRQFPEKGQTRVMLCTWDRHGLLAKAAAAFSAVRLNILEADVFTRADDLALDVFCVTDSDRHGPANPERLAEMRFLIEGALSEPPRFASVWACSRHKYLADDSKFTPRISLDNTCSPSTTLVRVEASDRLGLLYDILQTIADHGLNVTQAKIKTERNEAHDVFYVTDRDGQKVQETLRLDQLRLGLEAALT